MFYKPLIDTVLKQINYAQQYTASAHVAVAGSDAVINITIKEKHRDNTAEIIPETYHRSIEGLIVMTRKFSNYIYELGYDKQLLTTYSNRTGKKQSVQFHIKSDDINNISHNMINVILQELELEKTNVASLQGQLQDSEHTNEIEQQAYGVKTRLLSETLNDLQNEVYKLEDERAELEENNQALAKQANTFIEELNEQDQIIEGLRAEISQEQSETFHTPRLDDKTPPEEFVLTHQGDNSPLHKRIRAIVDQGPGLPVKPPPIGSMLQRGALMEEGADIVHEASKDYMSRL